MDSEKIKRIEIEFNRDIWKYPMKFTGDYQQVMQSLRSIYTELSFENGIDVKKIERLRLILNDFDNYYKIKSPSIDVTNNYNSKQIEAKAIISEIINIESI